MAITATPADVLSSASSIQAKRLCEITFECMWLGISVVKPGAHLGDIGAIIQKYAEKMATPSCASSAVPAASAKFHRPAGAALQPAGTRNWNLG